MEDFMRGEGSNSELFYPMRLDRISDRRGWGVDFLSILRLPPPPPPHTFKWNGPYPISVGNGFVDYAGSRIKAQKVCAISYTLHFSRLVIGGRQPTPCYMIYKSVMAVPPSFNVIESPPK